VCSDGFGAGERNGPNARRGAEKGIPLSYKGVSGHTVGKVEERKRRHRPGGGHWKNVELLKDLSVMLYAIQSVWRRMEKGVNKGLLRGVKKGGGGAGGETAQGNDGPAASGWEKGARGVNVVLSFLSNPKGGG